MHGKAQVVANAPDWGCGQDNLEAAISNYNKALGLHPEDTFTTEMLTVVLMESAGSVMPPDVDLPL
jgi:hypothetical protein